MLVLDTALIFTLLLVDPSYHYTKATYTVHVYRNVQRSVIYYSKVCTRPSTAVTSVFVLIRHYYYYTIIILLGNTIERCIADSSILICYLIYMQFYN